MVIRMSRPIARDTSRHLYARKRIPADILRILSSIPDWPRPTGWGQNEIIISTGPHHRPGETPQDTASRLYADMAATFARLRNGPQDLTNDQISAMAGEVYALAASPPEPSAPRSPTFTMGRFVDQLIADKGVWLTAPSRARLMDAILGKDGSLITATIHSEGTAHKPRQHDPVRFPAWQPTEQTAPVTPPGKAVKLASLVKRFLTEPRLQDKQLSALTIDKYRTILERFTDLLRNPDARTVTEEDIRSYLHSRLTDVAQPVTARTIHKGDLPAIKSLFTWATDRDQHPPKPGPPLTFNPASGIKIKTDKDLGIAGNDDAPFLDDEIALILSASLAITIGNDNPALDRAKRWAPWIAAYSGNRIEVICGLRGSDFVTTQGVYCMTFPPRKGYPSSRRVPVHEHLIEQGIREIVEAIGPGPLFHDDPDPAKKATRNTLAQNRASLVSKWVRSIGVTRLTAKPSHSWRGTFITRSSPMIPELYVRYISGHTKDGTGTHAQYNKPDAPRLAASLATFPRYTLDTETTQGALGGPQADNDDNQPHTQSPP